MTDRLLDAVVAGVQVFDLGRPLFAGMPQSPNHPAYTHTLPRRHGDQIRSDGTSTASDLIVTGTHVGTHVDALAHMSAQGRLHGGADAALAQQGGQFAQHGAHTIAPLVTRGLLFDLPAVLAVDTCQPGYEITVDDLEACAVRQQVVPRSGDAVLIRTGWGQKFSSGPDAYLGRRSGVPGVGEQAAGWLADTGAVAVGSDTLAFDRVPPRGGDARMLADRLPAHRVLLVERGVYIIESLDLEALAAHRGYEFTFILAALPLLGATGAPARPLAVLSRG